MELTIKGNPDEISVLLHRLRSVKPNSPKLPEPDNQFSGASYTRPHPATSLIDELSELTQKCTKVKREFYS